MIQLEHHAPPRFQCQPARARAGPEPRMQEFVRQPCCPGKHDGFSLSRRHGCAGQLAEEPKSGSNCDLRRRLTDCRRDAIAPLSLKLLTRYTLCRITAVIVAFCSDLVAPVARVCSNSCHFLSCALSLFLYHGLSELVQQEEAA